jgi:hypothetical protein
MAYTTMLFSGRRPTSLTRFPFPHLLEKLHHIWSTHVECVTEAENALTNSQGSNRERPSMRQCLSYPDDLSFLRKFIYHLELLVGFLCEDTSLDTLQSSYGDDEVYCDIIGCSYRPFFQCLYLVAELRKDASRAQQLAQLRYLRLSADRLPQTVLGVLHDLIRASYLFRIEHKPDEAAELLSKTVNTLRIGHGFWTAVALEEAAAVSRCQRKLDLERKQLTRACRVYRQFGIICKVRLLLDRDPTLLEGTGPQDYVGEWKVDQPKSAGEALMQQSYQDCALCVSACLAKLMCL